MWCWLLFLFSKLLKILSIRQQNTSPVLSAPPFPCRLDTTSCFFFLSTVTTNSRRERRKNIHYKSAEWRNPRRGKTRNRSKIVLFSPLKPWILSIRVFFTIQTSAARWDFWSFPQNYMFYYIFFLTLKHGIYAWRSNDMFQPMPEQSMSSNVSQVKFVTLKVPSGALTREK